MKPQNTGLVVLHDDKENDRGLCFKLMEFINEEAREFRYTEKYEDLWSKRFAQMKAGVCAYRDKCPTYARAVKKIGAIQLKLFEEEI